MKIAKNIPTPHGEMSSTAEIQHTDNGQVVIHVVSRLGDTQHSHTITVGAEDGNDAVANLTADEMQATLQTHLDDVRKKATGILSTRIMVQACAAKLQ